jgi:hypothetical protein
MNPIYPNPSPLRTRGAGEAPPLGRLPFVVRLVAKQADSAFFRAEGKLDGAMLGSLRIQSNQFQALPLEKKITLPDWLKTRPLGEAIQLDATPDPLGRLVALALFKTGFHYCQNLGIHYLLVTAKPPIDRLYERMLLEDVFARDDYFALFGSPHLSQRAMYCNLKTTKEQWAAVQHPFFDFMFRTHHADLGGGLNERFTFNT